MRFCISAYVGSPEGEGAGGDIHFWELLRALSRMVEEIHVVLPEVSLPDINNVHFHTVERGGSGKLARTKLGKRLARRTEEVCKKNGLDLIYTRSLLNGLALDPKKMCCHLVLEVNGIWSQEHGSGLSRWLVERAEKKLLAKARVFVAVSEGIKGYLVGKGIPSERVFVAENGGNVELFRPYT
ncbi:MAG: glycosyltransferase, partial [Thermoplasmata archaeon]|nr:glycosyltransferase [Thermoplasmata archaeon]